MSLIDPRNKKESLEKGERPYVPFGLKYYFPIPSHFELVE